MNSSSFNYYCKQRYEKFHSSVVEHSVYGRTFRIFRFINPARVLPRGNKPWHSASSDTTPDDIAITWIKTHKSIFTRAGRLAGWLFAVFVHPTIAMLVTIFTHVSFINNRPVEMEEERTGESKTNVINHIGKCADWYRKPSGRHTASVAIRVFHAHYGPHVVHKWSTIMN